MHAERYDIKQDLQTMARGPKPFREAISSCPQRYLVNLVECIW